MFPDQSRREFIKNMSVYGGTSFLLSFPWLTFLKAENSTDQAKLKIGIIGTGSRGQFLMIRLLQISDIEIVAVCDNYDVNLNEGLNLTQRKAKSFSNYKEMIDKIKLDGVIVATPLNEHAQMTIDCLEAGIHVFCEKSMALTIEDCKRMYNTHLKTGLVLQIGHQRMFHLNYLKSFDLINAGQIGQVTQIRAYWHRNGNWRRNVPMPELEKKINWRLYKEFSAGLMTELASHQIQIANYILKEVPECVMGSGSINFWKDGREVDDNVNLVYRYPSGVHLVYDSIISNKFYGCEEQIMGSKGTLEMEQGKIYLENPPPAPGILQLINDIEHGIFETIPLGGPSWIPETAQENKGKYVIDNRNIPDENLMQLKAFAKAIRDKKPIQGMAEEGYNSSVAALLGYQAMNEKKIIYWPEEYKIKSY